MIQTFTYQEFCADKQGANDVVLDLMKTTAANEQAVHNLMMDLNPTLLQGDWFEGTSFQDDRDYRAVTKSLLLMGRPVEA